MKRVVLEYVDFEGRVTCFHRMEEDLRFASVKSSFRAQLEEMGLLEAAALDGPDKWCVGRVIAHFESRWVRKPFRIAVMEADLVIVLQRGELFFFVKQTFDGRNLVSE